ncbi:hypothetical protein PIB30_018843 [Stylosanthes scabra]|uniref:Uncharacterized protein n=1 Tax=Stylosanthes scabra TaxID=79078 RepID=A0ABU6TA65_9FABA|nr:hypothetical protein [Stylosanthes scabra]
MNPQPLDQQCCVAPKQESDGSHEDCVVANSQCKRAVPSSRRGCLVPCGYPWEMMPVD